MDLKQQLLHLMQERPELSSEIKALLAKAYKGEKTLDPHTKDYSTWGEYAYTVFVRAANIVKAEGIKITRKSMPYFSPASSAKNAPLAYFTFDLKVQVDPASAPRLKDPWYKKAAVLQVYLDMANPNATTVTFTGTSGGSKKIRLGPLPTANKLAETVAQAVLELVKL